MGFFPPLKNNMCFEITSPARIVVFRRAYKENSHHIQILERTDKDRVKLVRELLPSSEESIRNHMVVSNSISSSENGLILFSFLAAKDVKVISPTYGLNVVPIDESEFKVSDTKKLIQHYEQQRTKGLTSEIFKNSRVLSLGFVTEELFAVTFATGRFDETKFYIQFYSIEKKTSVSKAFSIESPT